MFKRKLALILISVLVMFSLTLVAANPNSISIDDKTLTLNEIEFNIPDGYTEDTSQRVLDKSEGTSAFEQSYSTCILKNGDKKINITVKYLENGELTGFTNIYGRNTTLSDVKGCLLEDESKITNNSVAFLYLHDGKGVYISAPDVMTLEKVIAEQK